MDISKLCRSCMKEVATWEIDNFDTKAIEMFFFCTNIRITEDKLPKQFCYDCIIKIESSYTFITEAQKVNVTLKSMISQENPTIEPDAPKNIIESTENMKLTLPDYKISSTISNIEEPVVYKTKDNEYCNEKHNTVNIKDNLDEEPKEISEIEKKEDVKAIDNIEIKKNVCPVCRKSFTSKVWFSKHMEKEHTGHKYTCAHCPKTFSRPSQLAYHAASHSDERKYVCPTCGKRFKRRKQLAMHARAHADARPYGCDKCSARFKIKSVLKCHMKVHEGDKQYLCYFCGWSFAQAGNLKVHMRQHTGEKPFSCGECGFRAAVASNLRRHERRHRGARDHVCAHCRKGFYDASSLARHVRTHTGELPYQCPGCARAFADSWKRKTHLMRAHRLQLQDIPRMRTDGQPLH